MQAFEILQIDSSCDRTDKDKQNYLLPPKIAISRGCKNFLIKQIISQLRYSSVTICADSIFYCKQVFQFYFLLKIFFHHFESFSLSTYP